MPFLVNKNYIINTDNNRVIKININNKGEKFFEDKHKLCKYFKLEESLLDKISSVDIESEKSSTLKVLDQLQLLISTTCNMTCKYCFANEGKYSEHIKFMNLETAKMSLDTFFNYYDYIETITFFGGEPLLNYRIMKFVCEYTNENYKNRFRDFSVMSNLYYTNPEIINLIKKYNIIVATSLDGSEASNDLYRVNKDSEGTFKKVSKNIKYLREITGQPSKIEMTLSDKGLDIENKERPVSAISSYLKDEFDIRNFTINKAIKNEYSDVECTYELDNSVKDMINLFINKGVFTDEIYNFINFTKGKSSRYLCGAGISQFSIMTGGDIYPCQFFASKSKNNNFIDNIYNKDIIKNITKESQKNLKKYDKSKCNRCFAKTTCHICIANLDEHVNTLEKNCVMNRKKYVEYFNNLIDLYENSEKFNNFIMRLNEYSHKEILNV